MAQPNLQFYTTAGVTVSGLGFGAIEAGSESDVSEVILWNNRSGAVSVDTATGVRVSALDYLSTKAERLIREGWVLARASGITNPDTIANFFDDQQSVFRPLTDTEDLLIGDIPNNCGRHLFFKLRIPVSAISQTGQTVQMIAGHGGSSFPLPYFFNRAFGNGVVQEQFNQIFPAYPTILGGTYTFTPASGGAYSGIENKNYLINIVAGGTPGAATYRSSDDDGSSYYNTLATATNGFTTVFTSGGDDEGVRIAWLDGGGGNRLATGDTFRIHVETRPFQFFPGATNTLVGYVGGGNALVYNNRIYKQRPSTVSAVANTRTFVYLTAEGDFATSNDRNEPDIDRIWMGWFDATSVITGGCSTWPYVALGLDAYDDFTPMWNLMAGLSWTYFQGKFKKFNETIFLPSQHEFIGYLGLTAGVTNHIQVDPLYEQVKAVSNQYLPDHIPLFRVKTGTDYIESWIDDRARVGLAANTLRMMASLTTASVGPGLTLQVDFTDFVNRAIVRKLVVNSGSVAGATFSIYSDDSFSTLEYQAGEITDPYTDNVMWFHEDLDNTKELHVYIQNVVGVTQAFNFLFDLERLA